MCVYAYVTYVHVYTHVFVCMHVHLYVCMYVCIRISAVRRRKVVKPGQCPVGAACENPAFGVGVGFGFDLVSVAFSTQWSDLCDCLGCLRALLRGPWVQTWLPWNWSPCMDPISSPSAPWRRILWAAKYEQLWSNGCTYRSGFGSLFVCECPSSSVRPTMGRCLGLSNPV